MHRYLSQREDAASHRNDSLFCSWEFSLVPLLNRYMLTLYLRQTLHSSVTEMHLCIFKSAQILMAEYEISHIICLYCGALFLDQQLQQKHKDKSVGICQYRFCVLQSFVFLHVVHLLLHHIPLFRNTFSQTVFKAIIFKHAWLLLVMGFVRRKVNKHFFPHMHQ